MQRKQEHNRCALRKCPPGKAATLCQNVLSPDSYDLAEAYLDSKSEREKVSYKESIGGYQQGDVSCRITFSAKFKKVVPSWFDYLF